MKEFCKDFMGNDLKVGDYIAVSDKTYSKTPFMIYGQITNIEYEYTKSGDWSCTNIDYKFIGESDEYPDVLEKNNFKTEKLHGWKSERYSISKKGYCNILKVNR